MRVPVLSSILALVLPLTAQIPFTITSPCSPNGVFRLNAIPGSDTTVVLGTSDFRATGAAGTDQCYQAWWFYRTPGDTREYCFNSAAGSGFVGATVSPDGDSAVLRWVNVDRRGFDAELTYRIYSTGPSSAVVATTMTVRNLGSTTRDIHLFRYADFDIGTTAPDDRGTLVAVLPGYLQMVSDASTIRGYSQGCGAARHQVGNFPSIRDLLTDSVIDDLDGSGSFFGPGDWSGAHQWRLTLRPGASSGVTAGLAIDNPIESCSRAVFTSYCSAKAGTNGVAEWADSRLFVGGQAALTVRNGLSGASPIVLVGASLQVCTPVPQLGDLAINPILVTFSMPPFDSARVSTVCLRLPATPDLNGAVLLMQAWFGDPGALGAVAHTRGARFTIGGL